MKTNVLAGLLGVALLMVVVLSATVVGGRSPALDSEASAQGGSAPGPSPTAAAGTSGVSRQAIDPATPMADGLAQLSVVALGDGEPISGLVYVLHRSDARGVVADAGRTGERGEIEVDRLEPGAWTLQTEASGPWAAHLAQFELGPGDQAQRRIELSRGASVTGRCVDELGLPVAGVEVIAPRFADGASLWPERERDFGRVAPMLTAGEVDGNPVSKASSGPDGRFEVRGLTGGEARLLLRAPTGHAAPDGVPVVAVVADGEVVDVGDVVLRSPAVVVGAVLADGEPLVGARIAVEATLDARTANSRPHWYRGSLVHYEAVTDAAGEFELEVGGGFLERPLARVSDRFEQRWVGQLPTLRPGERVEGFVIEIEPRTPIRIRLQTRDGSLWPRVSTTSAGLDAAREQGAVHPPVLLDVEGQLEVCPTADPLVVVRYDLLEQIVSTPYVLGVDGLLEGQVCTPPDRPLEVTVATTEHEAVRVTLTPDGLGTLVGEATLVPYPCRSLRFVAADPLPRRTVRLTIDGIGGRGCVLELDTTRLPDRIELRGGTGCIAVRDAWGQLLVSRGGFPVGEELEVPLTHRPPSNFGGGLAYAKALPKGASLMLTVESGAGDFEGRRGTLRLVSTTTRRQVHRAKAVEFGESQTVERIFALGQPLELVIEAVGLVTHRSTIAPLVEDSTRNLGTFRLDPLPTFFLQVSSNNRVRAVGVEMHVSGSEGEARLWPWTLPLDGELELPIPEGNGPLDLSVVGELGALRGAQRFELARPRPGDGIYLELETWQVLRLEAASSKRLPHSRLVPVGPERRPAQTSQLPNVWQHSGGNPGGYPKLDFLCTAGDYRLEPGTSAGPVAIEVLDRRGMQTITVP